MMDVTAPDGTECVGAACDGGRDAAPDRAMPGEGGAEGGADGEAEGGGADGADGEMDAGDAGGGMDAGDAGGGMDAGDAGEAGGDVVVIPPGPCAAVGTAIKVANEARELARPVYVTGAGGVYAAGARSQDMGLDETFLVRVGADGSALGRTNVSQGAGALVEGGAVAPDGTGFVETFSSNVDGPMDVYLRAMTSTGAPAALAVRVSNDVDSSTLAQVAAVPGGWLVVWRTQAGTTGPVSLLAAPVSAGSYAVGAPVMVTPAGEVPGAFTLASDGTTAAVAYLAQDPSGGNAYHVVTLGASGAPLGGPFELAPASVMVSDAVAAAVRGDELFAAWAVQPIGAMTAARMDLSTGAVVQQAALGALGGGLSKPGAAADPGGGWVLAYRDGIAGGAVRIVRVGADLSVGEEPSLVQVAQGGDVVHVFAGGAGQFLVGWDDVRAGATTAFVELLQCP